MQPKVNDISSTINSRVAVDVPLSKVHLDVYRSCGYKTQTSQRYDDSDELKNKENDLLMLLPNSNDLFILINNLGELCDFIDVDRYIALSWMYTLPTHDRLRGLRLHDAIDRMNYSELIYTLHHLLCKFPDGLYADMTNDFLVLKKIGG